MYKTIRIFASLYKPIKNYKKMATPQLNLPDKEQQKFIMFANLDIAVKQQIFQILNQPNANLNTTDKLKTALETQISNLNPQELDSVISVYSILTHIKTELKIDSDAAIKMLLDNFERDKNPDLEILQKNIQDFKQLIENETARLKQLLAVMTDNAQNFMEAEIQQSIKPVFTEQGELLGSSIVHNLKLTMAENKEKKIIFLSLDDDDLDILENAIRKAKECSKLIKNHFTNAAII